MKWTEKYRINTHDCDPAGFVRASLVLRYMQETANLQMKNLGPTNEQLRDEGRAFLLSRINMSLYNPLYAGRRDRGFVVGVREPRGQLQPVLSDTARSRDHGGGVLGLGARGD